MAKPSPTNDHYPCPPDIQEVHWQEWIASAIDGELAEINLVSLQGKAPYERLLENWQSDRVQPDAVWREINRRFGDNWVHGGWWCSGVDVLTGEDSNWGCFKPDKPRIDKSKGFNPNKPKVVKYEHPIKTPTEIFALRVPRHIWQKISERYNVEIGSYIYFWEWVKAHPQIPVIVTEGCKKAAALLSAGYVGIALPGIRSGYRQPRDEFGQKNGRPYLIPQLQVFAQEGREINFCFDQDLNQKTIRDVNHAISVTAGLLTKQGCNVRVTAWYPKLGKGVDDLIVNHGVETLEQAINTALPIGVWSTAQLVRLTHPVDLEVNYEKLTIRDEETGKFSPRFLPPPGYQLVCIQSPKNTAKTELLSSIIAEHIYQGGKVLVLTHRIQLGEALCKRFGVDYVTELRESESRGVFGYGLCVDSLHRKSQACFNPADWEGAWVVIDEAEQVIWHLLNSSTCSSERVAILRCFKEVIQTVLATGGKIFLSDADLCDISIDYIRSLAGYDLKPWIVVNRWKPEKGWIVTNFSGTNPSQLVAGLEQHIQEGGIPFVCVSGQKKKAQWGSQNLESYLRKRLPGKKILRIDRESIADPEHPAYACMTHLNELLPRYDIVIASPSIETGVSVECKRLPSKSAKIALELLRAKKWVEISLDGQERIVEEILPIPEIRLGACLYAQNEWKNHFTSVWGIFQGVQTPDSARQALSRVRANVPRFLWARKTGIGRVGNGSYSVGALVNGQEKVAKANIAQLNLADFIDEIDTDFQPESLRTWAKRGSVVNLGMANYRISILEGLIQEGHTIVEVDKSDNEAAAEIVKVEVKETKLVEYAEHCVATSEVDSPDDKKYQQLETKRAKTTSERLQHDKGRIERVYKIPVTPDLVQKDADGWHPKIRLHYYFGVGRQYLSDREIKEARRQLAVEGTNGAIFKPDFNRRQFGAKIATLDAIGLDWLLAQTELRADDPELEAKNEFWIHHAFDIKAATGISINANSRPMANAQLILGAIGYRFPFLRKEGGRGSQVRIYGAAAADFVKDEEGKLVKDEQGLAIPLSDEREVVFAAWLAHDAAALEVAKQEAMGDKAFEQNVSQLDTVVTGNIYRSILSVTTEGVTTEVCTNSDMPKSETEELLEAFEFIEDAEIFAFVVEGCSRELVEDAIALSAPQPRRLQLQKWLDELSQPVSFSVGQRLRGLKHSFAGKIAKVTQVFGDWCQTTLGDIALSEIGSSWAIDN